MIFDKLDEKFNVEQTIPDNTDVVHVEEIHELKDSDLDDDILLARQTLRNLIRKGEETFETAMRIAQTSEAPRAYEVAGQLMKSVSDVTKELMDLQKKKADIKKEVAPKNVTQNNLFVGSTHELMKAMKQLKSDNE